MEPRKIIVLGASAGGLEVIKEVVRSLPAELDAAVFIVVHVAPNSPSLLEGILSRRAALPVLSACEGAPIRGGTITVGVPNHHLLLEPGRIRLTRGPRENRARPSIDVLFRSAAHAYSSRVIGTVLSGNLDDGTAGLWWIRDRGGVAVVQEPSTAEFPSMPSSALRHAGADHVVTPKAMGGLLSELSRTEPKATDSSPDPDLTLQVRVAAQEPQASLQVVARAEPSAYACPECHGVLFRLRNGGIPSFRCHTGHAYSIGSLLTEIASHADEAQWLALRALEEEALLVRELLERNDLTERAELEAHARYSLERLGRLRAFVLERRPAASPIEPKSS